MSNDHPYSPNMGPLRTRRTRAAGAAMPEEENLNPISCEVCRQRKSKCDRKLPFCSQCAGAGGPSQCIYPESGKRGLPLGYVSQLEHRLSETEAALYGALTSLRSLGQPITMHASAKTDAVSRQKATRMEEWLQLPLREWADMERWMSAMSDHFTTEQPGGLVPECSRDGRAVPATSDHEGMGRSEYDPHAEQVSYTWQTREGRSRPGNPSDAERPDTEIEPPIYIGHQATVEHEAVSSSSPGYPRQGTTGLDDVVRVPDASARGGVEIGRQSQAEELSRDKANIYF